jgi:hypothetical protein
MVVIRFVLLHGRRQPCANAPTPEPALLLPIFFFDRHLWGHEAPRFLKTG